MKPSKRHPNRRAHNWLIYDMLDAFLLGHTDLYRGAIYDLGCGSAPYREFFTQYADSYIGIDWAESYHDLKADIVADLNQPIPVESESADAVVCLSVLEHVYAPQTLLDEAHRILKPDGALVLEVPWQWWLHERPHDYFRYSPYGLRHLLGKAGFGEVQIEPQGGFCTMCVLKANYFSARFIRGPRALRWLIRHLLAVLWWLGQCVAPLLDRLDIDWTLESCGYFVTARRRP